MKISIALTTYNGAEYIEMLLESIYCQSRKVDEVFIADDGSKDNTRKLVQNFIDKKGLNDKWFLYQNEDNLGFAKNFWKCMEKTTGDLIFLCDQDDIWHENKVNEMTSVFEVNTNVAALICKENRIDEKGTYISNVQTGSRSLRKIEFAEEVRTCLGAGHLLAVSRALYNNCAAKIQAEGLTFDVPMCIVASVVGGLYQLDSYLVNRRIHKSNTSGIDTHASAILKDRERYIRGRKCRLEYYEFIQKSMTEKLLEKDKKEFKEAIAILSTSILALERRKIMPLLKEVFAKNRFINKKISLANLVMFLHN